MSAIQRKKVSDAAANAMLSLLMAMTSKNDADRLEFVEEAIQSLAEGIGLRRVTQET